MEQRVPTCQLAVDIGGTFTDTVASFDDGTFVATKVPSTPESFAEGVILGIEATSEAAGFDLGDAGDILHASTVATNALLERRGAACGLLTTRGFRDVLEIGRLRMPRLYEHFYEKPAPLVRRRHRREIDERVSASGEVLSPLVEADAVAVMDELVSSGTKSIAICLINSFANPEHELRLAKLLRERYPALYVSTSADVNPEVREFERTSATVVNAYVAPAFHGYLEDLDQRLTASGSSARLFIMQSNGGLQTVRHAFALPVRAIESGPAAGVVAGSDLARRRNIDTAITLDVGGTTAKASLIEGGNPTIAPGFEVGGEISPLSRLTGSGGYPVRVPAIDIAEVGAGGGSIAYLDSGGVVKVGPQSAGATPGPAAYRKGGVEPTVTDANVVLGYLGETLAGGTTALDKDAAARALCDRIAAPLGVDLAEIALGVHRIANSVMLGGLRAVSVERGRDVRDATLIAFGGCGPIHAATIARELHIETIVIPPAPGVFSARGLLAAPIQYDRVKTIYQSLGALEDEQVRGWVSELEAAILSDLAIDGFAGEQLVTRATAELRYAGQASELAVDITDNCEGHALRRSFDEEHERSFGHTSPGRDVVLINLRVECELQLERRYAGTHARHEDSGSDRASMRRAYFGSPWGALDTPVITRADLDATPEQGPVIIAEYDSTTVVPPDATVRCDMGDIVISRA